MKFTPLHSPQPGSVVTVPQNEAEVREHCQQIREAIE